ncbi:MipA/OmpV family protein [Rhodoblastus sp.]|uniref:MipA/OmpV family protein n=1 Tax=Rhodoblastus sp. TaxID=1962975 RepID=UPI003F9A7E79
MIAKFLAALLAASSILAGAGTLAGGAALAADSPPPAAPAPPAPDAYIVTLQAIGAVAPSFPGSSIVRPYPFPGVSVRGVGEPERFSAPDDGFGVPVFEADGARFGPVANFVFRRGGRDGLHGLHHVGLTHEVGGFAEYFAFDHFRTRAELRQAVDGHGGFVASLGADFYGESNSFRLSLGPRLNLGDNRYANAYFSVTPVEAVLNGRLEPYQASGGFTSAGGVATVRYDFTPNLNATVYTGLQRLTGGVGGSPIPNMVGSRDQFTAGVSLSRSFEVAKFW